MNATTDDRTVTEAIRGVGGRTARRAFLTLAGCAAMAWAAGAGLAAGPLAPERIRLADDFMGAVGPIWTLQRMSPRALAFVSDPVSGAHPVLALTLHPGDVAGPGGDGEPTERAELSEARAVQLPTGTDVWYGFSLHLPPDFPVVDRRLVLAQWKQACGDCSLDHSPAAALRYRNGVLSITVQDAGRRVTVFQEQADVRGRWLDVVVRLRVTPSPAGRLEAWLDGRRVADYQGVVGYPDDRDRVYFKMGLYRDHLPVPMTLLAARFRRGTSYAEVDPRTPRDLAGCRALVACASALGP